MALRTTLNAMLGVKHPILLAPMDIVADARLTLAVAEAGGFGFLGGGYGDEAWLRRELTELAGPARERGLPFGAGFITWSLARKPELLDIALDHGAGAIWLSFGDPAIFATRIRAAGAKLICQVQTEAMAKACLDAGADILVAQGAEAGGHGVSRGTLTLVPAVADLCGPRVPVVAAGGIGDGRGLAACLMLGAAGVALGTRFYATVEAAGFQAAKQRIVGAGGDDSMRSVVFDISRRNVWPAPFTGRCLRNAHLERWAGRELDLMRSIDQEGPRYAAARAAGDFEIAAVIAGEAAALIHDIPKAADVVARMIDTASELLRDGADHLG
ncbi:nitronate monooxygenase [Variovorax sp. CF079]|uniref:NAD(P)H-dependent flavin oxidoreductase n=1 Tax=Variovorax sp. CF079 TaxID=1882774 RepID=UPI0008836637|nr:nitronate monooxygenase [Variovorax sp. CF079]SDE70357.1 nitronate monooxygenase [Variovorax sp. CF079]